MKRLFIIPFVTLAFVIGATGAAPVAHAQANCDALNGQARLDCYAAAANDNSAQYDSSAATQSALQTAGATPAEAQAAAEASKAAAGTVTDNTGSPDSIFDSVMMKIMSLFAWLVGLAALALDYAVYYTVIAMGTYLHGITAVGLTWRILRDIGNIMLIFGFLAIGISIILNTERLGYGQKMLPMLLVAAVFINFSLFFSEAIIDVGNLFATQFFTQINGGVEPTPDYLQKTTIGSEGISNKIMSQLGLTTLYGDATNPAKTTTLLKPGNPWYVGFLGIMLFIVLAFVLFSLAFILVARFVILVLLIILAPIGFAGLAVPQLASTAKRWWDKLFQQTITAPVLLLLLYVALAVITDANFLGGLNVNNASASTGVIDGANLPGFAGYILSFLIAMGLLIAVTIAAKSLSAFGANAVSNVSSSASKKLTSFAMAPVRFAGRAAAGTGKWAVRSTAGRGLYNVGQAIRTSKGGQTQAGRLLAGAFDKGGKGFKEEKEKSTKTHEEYLKSVQTAIENKHAPDVIEAARVRSAAVETPMKVIEAAKEEEKELTKTGKTLTVEVERLEKLVKDSKDSGQIGAAMEAQAKLKQAQQAVEANKTTKTQAQNRRESAEEVVAAELKKEKAVNDKVSKEKKEAVLGYAENLQTSITQNPFTWVASGKGGNAAATKMLKTALATKSTKDLLFETLTKATKESDEAAPKEKTEEGKGGEKH